MRTVRFLLEKEFRQIFRNRAIVILIMVMPVMQLVILPLAANYEVKNVNISIVDHDHSVYSRKLVNVLGGSKYFRIAGYETSFQKAWPLLEEDKADIILEIPADFERKLVRKGQQQLFIAMNAINGVKANLGGAYLANIITDFNNDIRLQLLTASATNPQARIEAIPLLWYNPLLNYKLFMVPGILAILVTMIGGFLSALNIVKEKEMGTIEQINVTPVRKHHFILGKLIPFWVLGNVVFTLGLLVSRLFYGIVPLGQLIVLYSFVSVYLLAILGFGLLISTFCDTQQQAMFIMFFFMMIFILMGGLFTSIDSMPDWAKTVTRFNPVSYLVEVMRMVVLKGSGFRDISRHILTMTAFAIVLNAWAIWNYRKSN